MLAWTIYISFIGEAVLMLTAEGQRRGGAGDGAVDGAVGTGGGLGGMLPASGRDA